MNRDTLPTLKRFRFDVEGRVWLLAGSGVRGEL